MQTSQLIYPVMLTTQRLRLVPLSEDDRGLIVDLYTHPQVMTYVAEPLSLEQANRTADTLLRRVLSVPPQLYCWRIVQADTDVVVGTIALIPMKGEFANLLEIGALALPDFQGLGYIPEAMDCVCEYALADRAITGIYAKFQRKHAASFRITRKTGFSEPVESTAFPDYLECTRTNLP